MHSVSSNRYLWQRPWRWISNSDREMKWPAAGLLADSEWIIRAAAGMESHSIRTRSVNEMNTYDVYVVPVRGKKVEVSKEVFEAYYRPYWAEQQRKRRQGRCLNARGTGICRDDCSACTKWHLPFVVSLESLEGVRESMASCESVEEIVWKKERVRALTGALMKLSPWEKTMAKFISEGKSIREMANICQCSVGKMHKEKTQVLSKLRRLLEYLQ